MEQWTTKVEEILSRDIDSNNLITASDKFGIARIKKKWKVLYDSQFS
jgi:hypothetical protein